MRALPKQSPGKGRRPRTSAFTLVELLVVMAIIAVVAAMMLPALSKAKDKAQGANCQNNLRQMMVAMQMYCMDNEDRMAWPNWGWALQGWLYGAFGRTNINEPPFGTLIPTSPLYANDPEQLYRDVRGGGLWYPYIKSSKPYLCPVDARSPFFHLRHEQMSTYKMNGAVCHFSLNGPTVKLSEIWSPQCWLMWEVQDTNRVTAFWDGATYPDPARGESITQLHHGGGYVLEVGGRVSFVSSKRFQAEAAKPEVNLLWWWPGWPTGR